VSDLTGTALWQRRLTGELDAIRIATDRPRQYRTVISALLSKLWYQPQEHCGYATPHR
jgi:hypothetical protein